MILETLSLSFLPFTSNYFMNKLTFNMTQLLNELQIFESINIGKQGEANVFDGELSSSKNKKRKSGGNVSSGGKQKFQKKNKNKNKNKRNKKSNKAKVKGKCFHCQKEGHWKRNYSLYLEELKKKKKGKYDLLVLGSLFSGK